MKCDAVLCTLLGNYAYLHYALHIHTRQLDMEEMHGAGILEFTQMECRFPGNSEKMFEGCA